MSNVRSIRDHALTAVVCAAVVAFGLFKPATVMAGGFGEDPAFQTVPTSIDVEYDFLIDTVVTDQFTVIGNTVGYGVGFSEGGSGNYDDRQAVGPAGATVQYQLLDAAGSGIVVKDLDGAPDGSGLITGTIPVGWFRTTQTETFDVIVYQGQLRPPGTYTDTVTMTLYNTDDAASPFVEDTIVPISILVAPFIEISVVDPGGGFDAGQDNVLLDFGTLTEGLMRAVDLLVRANVDYVVTVDSMNAGVMAIISGGGGDFVPYTLEVDGSPQDLAGGTAQVLSGTGPTALAGNRHTFEFEIGAIAGATSGTYEDNLTITVTAQ